MRCLVDGERGLLIDNKRLSSLAARLTSSILDLEGVLRLLELEAD
jgi:hypothetical protein